MKNDMRVVRTKSGLRDALLCLMRKKQLKDIKVSEIASQAGVSRKAFYDHYGDIHDLIIDCYETLCIPGVTDSQRPHYDGKTGDTIWLIKHFTNQLEFFKANPQFARVALETVFSSPYLTRIVDEGTILANGYLEKGFPDEKTSDLPLFPKDTMARYLFFGNQLIIYNWIESGMKEPADALAQRIVYLDYYVSDYYQTERQLNNEYLRITAEIGRPGDQR